MIDIIFIQYSQQHFVSYPMLHTLYDDISVELLKILVFSAKLNGGTLFRNEKMMP